MIIRVAFRLLLIVTSFAFAAEMVNAETFVPYEEATQLICRGNINVILGGDSHLNVIEFDPALVKVTQLPGGIIDIAPTSRFLRTLNGATAVIRSNNRFKALSQISVLEESSLIAKDIESMSLAVDVKTDGDVMVEGVMNLNHLHVSKSRDVEIYWVDSHNLDVNVEKGNVVLAGRAAFLSMKGKEGADIDASGLIAKRSWVSGLDDARISVFPTQELYAYTKDSAIIDVKERPEVYAPLNQTPSSIVLNYVEMERRASARTAINVG